MSVNLFRPFAAWVTQFRTKLHNDIFFSTRLSITLSFFAICVITVFLISAVTDHYVQKAIDTLQMQPESVEETKGQITQLLWSGRIIRLIFILLSTYLLTDTALKTLREQDKRQRQFIDNVAHEIRTPLAIMKTSSEIAVRQAETLSNNEALDVIKSNLEEIRRISMVMSFFLTLANAEQHSIAMRPVALRDIMQRTKSVLQEHALALGIQFITEIDDSEVHGNDIALEEVLINLTKNALEHTPALGQVIVRSRKISPKTLEITVEDSGIGIPDTDLPYIFEPFYRGSLPRLHAEQNGTGLGLSIVKEIVHMHKGHIKVTSQLGKGTTFIITLPSA